MNCVLLRHRRRRRDGHERLGLLVVASCAFPVDAVGVVGCREDNSEEDEKYCEPTFQLPDTLVLVAAVLAVRSGVGLRREEREERKRVAASDESRGNNNRRNEQEPLIVEGKPMPPP